MNRKSLHKNKKAGILKDSYNRTIDYLRISVTDKCNLKCIYCTPQKKMRYFRKPDVLTYEEITRFVRIASRFGLRKVRITGGEPLLRRNIHSLVSSIKESGIRDVSITTNGVLLSEYAFLLKKAGLDRVNISLDTMDAQRYAEITNGGDIRHVWEAVREAEKVDLSPVKINVVPIRGLNDDEIVSFANLTFEKAFHIRFIEFMPVGDNSSWDKQKSVSSSEVIDRISTLGTLERISFRGRGPSRNYRLRGAKGVIGVISPLTDHFCRVCNRLRLSADGKLRPCLFSREETDIRTPLRKKVPDAEIERLFIETVQGKPRGHRLRKDPASSGFLESMSKIGG
jgi:cyclic pyranopterin phosphate synthase